MSDLVHLTVDDEVATITLDSPGNRNALSAALRHELTVHLDTAIADDSVRVIVLSHTGTVFCAGMDLKESRGATADQQGVQELPQILLTIWSSPKPVLARIEGSARAGGIGLVAACDIAIAVDTATFAFTEVRIGVVPAVISTAVLPLLSARAAHELFLTGETFDARRGTSVGLLNRAVPADELDGEVARYVEMLRLGAPGALAGTKELLRRRTGDSMSDEFAAMNALSSRYFAGDEGQEGLRAFAEKRRPAWAAAGSKPRPASTGATP